MVGQLVFLVIPLEDGGLRLGRGAVRHFEPNGVFIVAPEGADAKPYVDAVNEYVRLLALPSEVRLIQVSGVSLDDAVRAVRGGLEDAAGGRSATVDFAILEGASAWLTTVLLYTATVVRSVRWNGLTLGSLAYVNAGGLTIRLRKPGRYPIKLNLRTYRVLRIVARSGSEGALARDVHAALARQYGDEVSRQFVTNMLALLIRKGLVKRLSEGPNPTYHATSIGKILAG